MSQSSWGADARAGVVVALVALPLCLGIALASGAPLLSGLVTGVIGGLLVARLGGSPLLVSGPAAGLAAIVLAAITELGSFEALLAALVVAGLLQTGLGLLRAGRLAALVPSSVVTGMLAAIGVLLALQQLPYALGTRPRAGAHGLELLWGPVHALAEATPGPTLVAALALALLVLWERPAFARIRAVLPGPLVAVAAGTALAALLPSVSPFSVPTPARVDLPDLGAGLAVLAAPSWTALGAVATWRVALTLALVASLETLLSMEATDRLDPLERRSDGDRELLAQGLGNTLAGLLGGLPMTGVIVRSAANVSAGGRTWRAAFVHGALLAVAVAAFPGLLEEIPLAALAAVLLHTGWKLAHPSRFAAATRVGFGYALPLFATVIAVVATDLLAGVAFGLLVGGGVALAASARHGIAVVREHDHVRLHLSEAVSFLHKPRIRDALHAAPEGAAVTVDGSRTRHFDPDVLELLHAFEGTARDRSIRYRLVGVPAPRALTGH